MSVLETPRLFFRGQTTWDPITTNNHPAQYDENSSTTVFSPPDEKAAAFRKTAIDDVTANGNWNPDGTYRSRFFDTRVTGFDIGGGPVTDADGPGSDPIVGTPVRFVGMLVDLEPYGSISSQLFFDTMSFGIDGGCQIKARRKTRMIARYVNFGRYQPAKAEDGLPIAGVASVTWQTSFPTSHLTIGTTRSPVLTKFWELLKQSEHDAPGRIEGLTVRWTAYRTIYYDSLGAVITPKGPVVDPKLAQDLQNKLRLGGFQPNPARSEIVGVLGLWRKGEPAHEPGDRALLVGDPSTGLLASAHARASGDVLAIDLSNSVPEVDKSGTKMDLGKLVVTARSSDPAVIADVEIGTIPYEKYSRDPYDLQAGIVTLTVPGVEKLIENMDIVVTAPDNKQSGSATLVEEPFRAIAKMPNTYVDEGQSVDLTILAFEHGRSTGAGVKIDVVSTDENGVTRTGLAPVQLTTDAVGAAKLSITGRAGSVQGYTFVPHGAAIPKAVDTQQNTYALVRTLSADRSTALKPPTWNNVYQIVLRNWKAMAPCMDNWMRFDDEKQVRSFKPILKIVTDPERFESFDFMPVTRDMTPGARTLLHRFLDSGPDAAPAATVVAERSTGEERDLPGLSRSLRQG